MTIIICTTQKCFKYDDNNKKKLYTMFVNIMCNMQERKFDSQTLE